MKLSLLSLSLAATALFALPSSSQGVYACGYQDLNLVMEQVPSGWWNYGINNNAMALWNRYMDVYRYIPSDGTWGRNGVSEFAGWPSNADLQATWGVQWSNAIGLTMSRTSGTCGQILESDVAFNPNVSWTDSASYAEDNLSTFYYPFVLLHELGHTWGEKHGATSEMDLPSVMHGPPNGLVTPPESIHTVDAYLLRRVYDDQTAVRSRKDMAVFSHYAENGLLNTFVNGSTFLPGQSLTVRRITVENTGTRAIANAHIRLVLSTDRTITASDRLLGDWYWGSFPAEAWGTYDLTADLPSDLRTGAYYVGALISSDGYGGDDLSANDVTRLRFPIGIQCADDRFEPNDFPSSATPVTEAPYYALQACRNDDDWYRVFLLADQALDVSVSFSHANGDIDVELFDSGLQLLDVSPGVTDSELVGFPAAPYEGWYYVRVFGFAGAENGYSMSVDVGPIPPKAVLTASTDHVAAPDGGTQVLNLCGGPAYAGRFYLVLGSLGGAIPGFDFRGHHFPLNFDPYFQWTATHFNRGPLVNTFGRLDADGLATAAIRVTAPVSVYLYGQSLHHAFVVLDAQGRLLDVSNAVPLRIEAQRERRSATPTSVVRR